MKAKGTHIRDGAKSFAASTFNKALTAADQAWMFFASNST